MIALTLYSTSGCHLCEEAMALLDQVGVKYTVQDIIDQAALVERYGIKIPVVAKIAANTDDRELDWPFDLIMLKQFLEN